MLTVCHLCVLCISRYHIFCNMQNALQSTIPLLSQGSTFKANVALHCSLSLDRYPLKPFPRLSACVFDADMMYSMHSIHLRPTCHVQASRSSWQHSIHHWNHTPLLHFTLDFWTWILDILLRPLAYLRIEFCCFPFIRDLVVDLRIDLFVL